jgi:hypothetical protein
MIDFILKFSTSLNASTIINYTEPLNEHANVRDYLIQFISNLPINTLESIKLQAFTLALFTQATNQLTRTASVSNFLR